MGTYRITDPLSAREGYNVSFFSSERGFVGFKTLLVLLVLFGIVYSLIKLVPPYMGSERMKDEMAVKARLAQTLTNEEILSDLVKKSKELDLPLDKDDFKLMRDEAGRRMKISTMWDFEVNFFWGTYIRNLHFEPVIDESYARQL